MLNVEKFYNSLVERYGISYAAQYFDNWYRFWLSCGDNMQFFDGWRYCLTRKSL